MRTCRRFERIKSGFERDIRFMLNHAERHQGSTSGKVSQTSALGARQRMAKALSRHFQHCRECG
ncbi:hypothetical protein ADK70_38560 [Streptomyces rimosus subsp. pseudoverticillatus]|uniref:Uncharacterized protein n=1 Tax=Streptomyces paromomycinus TaxID=92743 RepID=A0A401VXP8_STREY|nr:MULTISPECIES: hypothetical protein [Streptomyces]KOT76379.1 hypothetical protein ADK70_38560 [Streptomyces rimosus subsp. pseudoverticillatus]RSO42025.1 hypothetical protein DMH15_12435 [Streptomyces sp. WAC 06725]GCD41815.1 hypothetical protein GKJPGBOP_01472 [Streptomyces paromomycinus]